MLLTKGLLDNDQSEERLGLNVVRADSKNDKSLAAVNVLSILE